MILKKKTVLSPTSAPKKQIVKVNPYENPENVMELMSSICSAEPTADINIFWNLINDARNNGIRGNSLNSYLKDNRGNLHNYDFEHNLNKWLSELALSLSTRENSEHTKIVVAGGFSSGKSSFLNRLTNCTNLLPTGVEPVSVVKTYLYCSRNNQSVTVRGVNHKNGLVNLDKGVLQAIQHSGKSNVFLASVLDKLFVDIPTKELDGLVFVDTPGYNNSEKANQSNGKTDRETAKEALKEGQVLFWFVGIDRPTLTTDDIEMIKSFNGPKVVIFNKADKKINPANLEASLKEIQRIVDTAASSLYKQFNPGDFVDILAYSALDNKIYCSKNNLTWSDIVKKVRKTGNGVTEINDLKEIIGMLFDDEIAASQDAIKDIDKHYKEILERKNSQWKYYNDAKDYRDYIVQKLNTVLFKSYDEVIDAADKISKVCFDSLSKFEDFLLAMRKWDNEEHSCWSNTLTSKINYAFNEHRKCVDNYNVIIYQPCNEDDRKELVERVKVEEDFVVKQFKDGYDETCQECNSALERKNTKQALIKDFTGYRDLFMSALEMGINMYRQKNKATVMHESEHDIPNVFDCIRKDDYRQFLRSFEDGVDLSVCNADGYNPLTFAVHNGNNMMVRFMLDHDADPSIKDKRGYNAFHTAVENQYRVICKMLLDTDPDLIETKTASGESAAELAGKHTFSRWIEKEIAS